MKTGEATTCQRITRFWTQECLAPESLPGHNEELRKFLDGLKLSPALARHLARVEAASIEAIMTRQEARRRARAGQA